MGYLQLADNGSHDYSSLAEPVNVSEHYIFIPNDESGMGGQYVREDYFDNLTGAEYEAVMDQLEPYQDVGVSGLFSGMRDRMRARRDARKDKRAGRVARRDLKATSKAERRTRPRGKALEGIMATVGDIFGKTQVDAGLDFQTGKGPEAYFQADTKPFYTKPVFIIGASAVVLGGIYLATRKKK